jgi:hypothetical protein
VVTVPKVVSRHEEQPIRICLVNDYEVVLAGVAHLFDRYPDRLVVVEIDLTEAICDHSTSRSTTTSLRERPTTTTSKL